MKKLLTALMEVIKSNHPDMKCGGFAHLANVGSLAQISGFEIAEGLAIRKALPNEAATLRSLLQVASPPTLFSPRRNPYETRVHREETKPGNASFKFIPLPEPEWRYHVAVFSASGKQLWDFIDASILTRCRLELGPSVFAHPSLGGPGMQGGATNDNLWKKLEHDDNPLLSLGQDEVEDLRLVYSKLQDVKDDLTGLRDSMRRYSQLDAIPEHSAMRFLGYVSVLESLITHNPKPSDPYDSLTRQVCQKMLLLGHRCCLPIPYLIFGNVTPPATLWKKLYAYRSAVAHGVTPDFKGELLCLQDSIKALEFIKSATISVMRQALEEPQLVADLREC